MVIIMIMQNFSSLGDFLISTASADTSAAAPQGGGMSLTIMLVVFVAFMYFMIWRPQSKRAQEHKNLINSLANGDEVVTAGGILGKVASVSERYIRLGLADNLEIVVQKNSVVNVLPKGTIKSLE